MSKVIARLVGGLGNQMFGYAAARRLALINDAELVLDTVTGFKRDTTYRRSYQLDAFAVAGRPATPSERLEPFDRARIGAARALATLQPYHRRRYLLQEFDDYDARLRDRVVRGTLRLQGVWAGEGYFADVGERIRADFQLKHAPDDAMNRRVARAIETSNAIGLHVRWFDDPGVGGTMNVSPAYYQRAIAEMRARVADAHFFVFSDKPDAARQNLMLGESEATFVTHNDLESGAALDLWLLSRCRHYIIANSSFSWWAAWLGGENGIVMCPDPAVVDGGNWNLRGYIPDRWVRR